MNLMMFLQTWSDEQMKAEIAAAPWGNTAHFIMPTVIFIVIVALVALFMSLFNMTKNPGALKKALFGFLGLGAIFLIAYLTASDKVFPELVESFGTSKGTFKLVGAGITTTMILILFGILLLVFDAVKGLFKI